MLSYKPKRSAKLRDTSRRRHLPLTRTSTPTVVTIMDASLHRIIEVGSSGDFACIHAPTLAAATATIETLAAHAVLVSPAAVQHEQLASLRRLAMRSIGMVVVIVVGPDQHPACDTLLRFGACGIRHVVHLADREGWNRLRSLLFEIGDDLLVPILARLDRSLVSASPETRQFFGLLVRGALRTTTARQFCIEHRLHANTLTSRFFRLGLPSPKTYLTMLRLVVAAALLERPCVSIALVAHRLGYSSPQAFGRHVRTMMGVRTSEFRQRFPFGSAMDHFVEHFIDSYLPQFATFRPLDELPPLHVAAYEPQPGVVRRAAEA